MKRTILVVSLFVAPFLAGCSTWTEQQFVGPDDYELARHEAPDGALETYRLQNGRTLEALTEYERERAFLGFQVDELDKRRAVKREVEPYSGLLVTGSDPESGARLAGVRKNDVLLAIDGKELVYLEQLAEVEAGLRDQQEVGARLLRGETEIELRLRAKLQRERISESEVIALESAPPSQRAYAGVTLRGIPRAWCERIFGQERDAVVVATVEVGSPAWLAGVRDGDVIETVDGQPVPPVAELSRRIAAKGPAEETMRWVVRREQGRTHEAAIALEDYRGEGHFGLPLLFSATNGTFEDRWRLGLGLIMGNRNHYVADASTRRVQTRNVFSALLGLIKVDSQPNETRVRLLWFIRFDT